MKIGKNTQRQKIINGLNVLTLNFKKKEKIIYEDIELSTKTDNHKWT